MLKIIIDYDDVLNDCNQAAVDRLNKEKRTRFFLSDIHDWGKTGTLLDERIKYFKDPAFMEKIPLKKGAQNFVKQLTKNHEVFIATSIHPDCAGVRVNEIIQKFPSIDPANILIGQRKDLLTADVLLDDNGSIVWKGPDGTYYHDGWKKQGDKNYQRNDPVIWTSLVS